MANDLDRLVFELLSAQEWPDTQDVIARHPELLSDAGDATFARAIARAVSAGDDQMVTRLRVHRELLVLCRAIGTDAAFEHVVELGEPEPVELAPVITAALAAEDRHRSTGDVHALGEATEAWSIAVRETEAVADRPRLRTSVLARAGFSRLELTEIAPEAASRDAGLALLRRAIEGAPTGYPELARALYTLGRHLDLRYQHTDREEDLDAAVDAFRRALRLLRRGAGGRSSVLSGLAVSLRERFARTQDPDDISQAVDAAEAAVEETDPHGPWLAGNLAYLSWALLDRSQALGGLEDLDRARDVAAWARQLAEGRSLEPGVERALSSLNSTLGTVLLERFRGSDDVEDLDCAIATLLFATEREPEPVLRAGCTLNLTNALLARFRRTGRLEDLDISARTARQALDGAGDAPPEVIAGLLQNLGAAHRAGYTVTTDLGDLDQAMDALREAAKLAPANTSGGATILDDLANAIADRHARLHEASDLDEAIALYEQVLERSNLGPRETATVRANLGLALSERYRASSQPQDLDTAIELTRQALDELQGDAAATPGALHNLGRCLAMRFDAREGAGDLEEAVRSFRESCELGWRVTPGQVATAARLWGDWASRRGSWREAAEAYGFGVEAVRRLVAGEIEREHKEAWIHDALGLPAAAAFAMTKVADVSAAVGAVEDGRALLLSESLRLPATSPAPEGPVLAAGGSQEELVYLVPTEFGGVALIVSGRSSEPIQAVDLPELEQETLLRRLLAYFTAYARRAEDLRPWLAALDETTHWLWQAVMRDVMDQLSAGSRATLIPLGFLQLLPLHAAWRPDTGTPTGRTYALDSAVLTYAPNARSFRKAREAGAAAANDAVLATDDPQPVQAPVPTYASQEVQAAMANVSRSQRIRKQRATRQSVLDALGEYGVLHLACHGIADPESPMSSALLMAPDDRLTLADLAGRRLGGVRLAVLSACETAMPGFRLPDEVLGFPTALQQTGVPAVVSSMWSVNDRSTALLMCRFYERWRASGLEPSAALRDAQQWVRDATNAEKMYSFPSVAMTLPERVSGPARALWEMAQPHDHPYHWAGFVYVGA